MGARSPRPGLDAAPAPADLLGPDAMLVLQDSSDQTLAVIWYSGTPMIRPRRSWGVAMPRSVRT